MKRELEDIIEVLKGIEAVLVGLADEHEVIRYQEYALLMMAQNIEDCIEKLDNMECFI